MADYLEWAKDSFVSAGNYKDPAFRLAAVANAQAAALIALVEAVRELTSAPSVNKPTTPPPNPGLASKRGPY